MSAREWMARAAKPVIFVVCLIPLALLVRTAVNDALGANPIETINRYLGDWALRFLLITLSVTPLRQITGWHDLIRFRRMLGLFAFFYVCLHVTSYTWLDQSFNWDEILKDVIKRPFITVGFLSLLMLIPLAATSTDGMVRRLGAKRWRKLHKLVYAIGVGGVLHFFWMVKSDLREPLLYAAILALLLGYRVWVHRRRKRTSVSPPATAAGSVSASTGPRPEAGAR